MKVLSLGFVNTYQLNGDLFRGTVDWTTKYWGFLLTPAAYFQHINENAGNFLSSSSGTTTSPGTALSRDICFCQVGQVGYMLSKTWEVVRWCGQFLSFY